jgi:Geranylgeranyl pyrophosphate synthase
MAYQIQDDILDITSSKNKEGKPVFNDLSEGVITLPIILYLESKKYSDDAIKKFSKKEKEGLLKEIINSNAIEKSKETVNSHYDKALNSLANIPQSEYSKALESMIEISRNRI